MKKEKREIIEIQIPGYIPNFARMPMLMSSIMETANMPTLLTVDILVADEDELKMKVEKGADFRFNWTDGNQYQFPVSAVYCWEAKQVDMLGIEQKYLVGKLELTYSGNINDYKI